MNVKSIVKRFTHDKDSRAFITHNRDTWSGTDQSKADGIVLLYYSDIPLVIIADSYFTNILARKYNAKIVAFSSTRRGFPWNALYSKKDELFRSFNTQGFIRTELNRAQEGIKRKIVPEITKSIKTKQDVYDLTIDGIWIGIDIYETYLRINNKPTIDLKDQTLYQTIEQAVGILVFWRDYIKQNSVKAIVVTHDVYIFENILCKLGYQNNIPVYLPNVIGGCHAQKPFSVYDPLLKDYPAIFRRLSPEQQQEGLKLAERQLQRRLSGEVGVDMHYSTKSAFSTKTPTQTVLKKSDKIKVLICSHCFYDNPHAYGKILFVDFYEWLCFLGEMTLKTDYDWYIKMHPDPLPGTEEIIKGIIAKYPKIIFIPSETSHLQLVAEGLNFVLTVYGSVGHELAALGVQVINAGFNPHIAYDFNWHPQTLAEYERYLLDLAQLKKPINPREIYEFYYMNYYYRDVDDLVLNSYREYEQKSVKTKEPATAVYKYFLDHLTDQKHQNICAQYLQFIESQKQYFRDKDKKA